MLVMVELEVGLGRAGKDDGGKKINCVLIVPFQVAVSLVVLWILRK